MGSSALRDCYSLRPGFFSVPLQDDVLFVLRYEVNPGKERLTTTKFSLNSLTMSAEYVKTAGKYRHFKFIDYLQYIVK